MTELHQISIENNQNAEKPHAIWTIGFRPFFLFGSLYTIINIILWLLIYNNTLSISNYYPPQLWHGHEMLYGFTAAIIAGFLLTAVRNWTSGQTAKGYRLLTFTAIWALGRILPFITNTGYLIAIVDCIFLPLITLDIAKPLIAQGNKRNYIMPLILCTMACSNILIHLNLLNISTIPYTYCLSGMLHLVVLLMVIIAGRVIPYFTIKQIAQEHTNVKRYTFLEPIAALTILILFLLSFVDLNHTLELTIASLCIIIHIIRMIGWHDNRIWKYPLLWILWLGYAWIVLGILCIALQQYIGGLYISWHAWTTGAIGSLIIGMMARVSLGHTGRPLISPTRVTISFITLQIAAITRVLGPIIMPQHYLSWLTISTIFWAITFLLFLLTYTIPLITHRPDGKIN